MEDRRLPRDHTVAAGRGRAPMMPSPRRLPVVTAIIFIAISATLFAASRGERSGYLLSFVSFPVGLGLYGYNFVEGDQPVMAENLYYMDQTVMFSGAGSRLSLYFTSIRPLYAFIATLFSPLAGVMGALAFVNYLSWALAGYVAWRFTLRLFDDEWAAAIAVVFVAFGLGFVIHAHDYSPHLQPFAMYYLGTLIVFESGVWRESRPLRTHVRIGTYLAVAALGYSTGLVLTAAYVLVAIRRNKWLHVAAAAAIGVSSQYVWNAVLNIMNSLAEGRLSWINVQKTEQDLLTRSIATWASAFADPLALLKVCIDGVLQFGGLECPLLIVAAVACWLLQTRSREQRWFDVVFAGMPIAVALVYLHAVVTRGYMSYGMSLFVYSTLAGSFAAWLRSERPRRTLAIAAMVVVIGAQVGWSTSHFRGYVIPIKMFYGFGDLQWIARYYSQWQLPPAISLTGLEPTPVLFGGRATMHEAGLVTAPEVPTPTFSWRFGLVSRAFLVAYLALMAAAWGGRPRWPAIALGAAVIWVWPVLAAKVSPLRPPPVYSTFDSERIRAGDRWHYSVELGAPFLEAARRSAPDTDHLEFMVGGIQPPFRARVTAGGQEIAVASDGRMVMPSTLDVARILGLLEQSHRLELELSADRDTRVYGWQRPQLPGRHLQGSTADLSVITALPAFEVRFISAKGRPLLIGF